MVSLVEIAKEEAEELGLEFGKSKAGKSGLFTEIESVARQGEYELFIMARFETSKLKLFRKRALVSSLINLMKGTHREDYEKAPVDQEFVYIKKGSECTWILQKFPYENLASRPGELKAKINPGRSIRAAIRYYFGNQNKVEE